MYTQQIQESRTWLAGQISRCSYSGIQAPSSKCSAGFCISGGWKGSQRISCAVFSTVPESNPECFHLPLRTSSYGHTWKSLTGQPLCPGLFYHYGSYALSFHKLLVGKKYWNWQIIKNTCHRQVAVFGIRWENCHFKTQLTKSSYIATIKSASNESSINPDWCTESGKVGLKAHETVYHISEIPPFS